MIAAGLLRAEIGKLLRPAPKKTKSMDDRAKSALMRSSRLRGGAGGFLSKGQWEARRLAWSARGNNNSSTSADAAADDSKVINSRKLRPTNSTHFGDVDFDDEEMADIGGATWADSQVEACPPDLHYHCLLRLPTSPFGSL